MAAGTLPRKRRLKSPENQSLLSFEAPTSPPSAATLQSAALEPVAIVLPSAATDPQELLSDVKVRFGLIDRETRVLGAILEMDDAQADPDYVVWSGTERSLAAAAGIGRNTASRAIEDLETKGIVTSRQRSAGGGKKEYRVRLDLIAGRVSTFGSSIQLTLQTGRAHAATLGAPSFDGGRAQAATVGAPRGDSPSRQANASGRAHPHELNEVNESKIHSLNSVDGERAHPPPDWNWMPSQLADPTCVDTEVVPAAIARFGLLDSMAVRQGIAAAACCACDKGTNAPGMFTRFIETRAWERTRSARRGETWIAERWFEEARQLRKQSTPSAAPCSVSELGERFRQPVLESELDTLPADAIAGLATRALRSNEPAKFAWQNLRTMRDRLADRLIRPLLLGQLAAERSKLAAGVVP